MTDTAARSGPDRPCIAPGNPTWNRDAQHLASDLRMVAAAAETADACGDPGRYLLSAVTFHGVAAMIGRLATHQPPPDATCCLLPVPAWETSYLWDVLVAARRCADGDPEASELADLLDFLGDSPVDPPRTVADIVTSLEKVAVVLLLDIPAVRILTTELVLQNQPDAATRDDFRDIRAARQGASISH